MKTKLVKKVYESSTSDTVEVYRVIQGNLVLASTRDYDHAKGIFEGLRRPPSPIAEPTETVLEEFDS